MFQPVLGPFQLCSAEVVVIAWRLASPGYAVVITFRLPSTLAAPSQLERRAWALLQSMPNLEQKLCGLEHPDPLAWNHQATTEVSQLRVYRDTPSKASTRETSRRSQRDGAGLGGKPGLGHKSISDAKRTDAGTGWA
ncbi:hypothetical protein B0H17DRAFT_1124553 [Mycena rosella]|uniref:Uncharacterized protein n=1 Tax=Mycena rosella TaxID=1033263 RepID=A0AAD7GZV2_MYCRO|nr:hypothetical protein B0H17DRAFT_1124553 [Mycena rosella]